MHKTTARDFKLFQQECNRWIEYFGLKGWDVDFALGCPDSSLQAGTQADCQPRNVTLYLGVEIDDPVKHLAQHEVAELLLARLNWAAERRNVMYGEIDEARHEVIQILQNTLFKDVKPRLGKSKASVRR